MLLMLILCTVGAFVMEPELGAGKLCRATKHGRRRQPVYQALTAFLICITLQLLTYGMELYRVFQVYELDRGTLSFAAASIPELAGFETTMTLSGYLLLVNVVRLVGYLIALYLLYRLSHRLASMSAAITVAAVVLLVPLIIQYLTDGIPLVSAIYSLVLGNEFLI